MVDILDAPIFFKRNRVKRVYKGGLLFHDFFGDKREDDFCPEEWIASVVTAINKDNHDMKEGLSIVEGSDVTFLELIEKYPKEMIGNRKSLGVLVKLLDSAVRLPVQVHPDKEYSEKYFQSRFGKTEMWIIIATRENAKIYLGFKEKTDKTEFGKAVEQSFSDKQIMKTFLNEISVKAGDIYLIPARIIHAIGEGCLILEVQEPTDFTIQPEYWCDEYKLNEEEMYLRLSKEEALECFDFSIYGDKCISLSRKNPITVFSSGDYKKEIIISEIDTPCFRVNRYEIFSRMQLNTSPAVYIITKGKGIIEGNEYRREIRKGDYFFLPNAAKDIYKIKAELPIELLECLPPKE